MKEKLPPQSGLDFGAMMDEIDDREDLKSIAAGQGLWLSSKALAVVLVVFELLLVVVGVVVYYWTRAKFS